MSALLMTSWRSTDGSSADDGTYAHFVVPAAAFSAATRVASDSSVCAAPATTAEFSISVRPSTSELVALIAATILACWRARLAASHAPRGPLPGHELTCLLYTSDAA